MDVVRIKVAPLPGKILRDATVKGMPLIPEDGKWVTYSTFWIRRLEGIPFGSGDCMLVDGPQVLMDRYAPKKSEEPKPKKSATRDKKKKEKLEETEA